MKRMYYNLRRLEGVGAIERHSKGRGNPVYWRAIEGRRGQSSKLVSYEISENDSRYEPRLLTHGTPNSHLRLQAFVDWVNEHIDEIEPDDMPAGAAP